MKACENHSHPQMWLVTALLIMLMGCWGASSHAASQPIFSSNASGTISNLTLTANLIVGDSDAGQPGNIYLAAYIGSAWFAHNGVTWVPWSGGQLPVYSAGVLSSRSIEVVRNTDLSTLGGTQMYLGYGLSESDMLTNGKYGLVYTVSAPVSSGIIFLSSRDGWENVWVMNEDGSNPRRLSLSQESYAESYPSSSSDGSKIVFVRYSKGIVVLDGAGERIIRNSESSPMFTTWSHDGKIYFTRWNVMAQNAKEYIYSINADGSGETQVSPAFSSTANPLDSHPSLSPDGTALVFDTNRTGNGGTITKLMLADGSFTYLTYSGNVLGESVISPAEYPTWSPDGTKIAFAAYPGYPDFNTKEQIYVMNADGSGKVKLTAEAEANCRFPSWSPDGSKIVFQKDYPSFSNPTEIWIMNSDGSGAKALTDRNVTHSDAQPSFVGKPR